MKRSIIVKFLGCVMAFGFVVVGSSEVVTTQAATAQIDEASQSDVIVILRDQLSYAPPVRREMNGRAAAVAAAQAPVVAQLQQARRRAIYSFRTINAFATRVSPAEAAALAAHPLVLAVMPDLPIHARRNPHQAKMPIRSAAAPSTSNVSTAATLCNTLEPEGLQLMHAAFADPSIPQAQEVRDGNNQRVTGKGVKVAYLADGLDPNVAGFIRPDGSHVFIDYEDFTGDPAGTITGGGEAFGDASSVAAQDDPYGRPLLFDISSFVSAAHPLPSPCDIRIRGMAPGASLVGLNIISSLGFSTRSTFIQAIEWAVTEDDVDVINESFGLYPLPDSDNDPISLANSAAIRAGVTVVVSTGDAGTNGTLGDPATSSDAIAVGATNQYRIKAQTGGGAYSLSSGGIVDNNIASFSSGGFAQNQARTVDVVAPGDSGWALCSTDTAIYSECTDNNGNPSAIETFGGTSEAAPFTAGEAALIIQAYRSMHRGADPAPALVKQIIMSTATDLGAPADEQGAGLINALAAVNAALSVVDEHGRPKPVGSAVLSTPGSVRITDTPGTQETRQITFVNTGTTAVQLSPALQSLGAPIAGATLNLRLIPNSDPTFYDEYANRLAYIEQTFKVPAGAQHLDVAIAFQSPFTSANSPYVEFALLDPSGNQANLSQPQGFASGYGHVDVVNPAAGVWTAVIWTTAPGSVFSYSGPVQFTWAAENYVSFGSVKPARLSLAPGASASLTAEFAMPAQAGDSAVAIRFGGSAGAAGASLAEIPISLRTLIPTGPTGGSFTGTLTGGNGRDATGPTQTFEFNVPNGVKNMSLVLEISDSLYLLEGLLIDPQGMQLSVEPNLDTNGNQQFALQLSHYNPQPGRWKFVLLQNYYVSGKQTSLPFTARINFNDRQITARQLPDSPAVKLSVQDGALIVPIRIVNSHAVTEAYFADARLPLLASTALPLQPCTGYGEPTNVLPGGCGGFLVPTEVTTIQFTAQSSLPIQTDALNDIGYIVGFTGSPDIFGKEVAPGVVAASLSEPEIPWGEWDVSPALIGPYGASGAPTVAVNITAQALMQAFDTTVAADSGDYWADVTLGTNTFNPLVLASGESGTINLTITPNAAQVGQTMTGFVYIDTFNSVVATGDEVMRLPYSYTVVP